MSRPSPYRYKIVCCEFDSVNEHAAILESNAEEGWEFVTLYESQTDWRFVFRMTEDLYLS